MKLSSLSIPLVLVGAWMFTGAALHGQTFERRISEVLDERPNCIDHTNDGGYIIAGTQKDLPMG